MKRHIENTPRIEYIDHAKGFTILLVILGHLYVFCLGDSKSEVHRWLASFEMPLFIFLSGMMASRAMKDSYGRFLIKKGVTLLLPFFCLGSLYVGLIRRPESVQFWHVLSHGEYWFTWCLFLIYIVYRFFQMVYNKLFGDNKGILIGWGGYWCIVVLILLKILSFRLAPEWMNKIFNLSLVITYFPYFIFGVLISNYKILERCIMSYWGYAVMLIAFWSTFFLTGAHRILSDTLDMYLLGFTGTLWVIGFLKRYVSSNPFGSILSVLGRRSLDIYVLHYFVLAWLPLRSYSSVILNNGLMFELVVSIVLASLIAAFTMLISTILRVSPILSFSLLGDYKALRNILQKHE